MKKTYLKRDGAVAALRKAGVKPEDYEANLAKVEGGFEATLPDAPVKAEVKEALKGLKASVDKQAKKAKAPKKAKAKKEPKEPRVSIGSVVRDLVKKGKNNAFIWGVIKKQFKLDDSKKWYPAWYRSDVKRRKAAGK